jgi:hypothetical protein
MTKFTTLIVLALLVAPCFGKPPISTWDEYGCKADDPAFDNGPVLSRMIADEAARKLKTAPIGTLDDYYIKTPINWPGVYGCALEGSGGYAFAIRLKNIGATRIIWNGPAGGTMLNYRGDGGRIGRLMLCGGPIENFNTVAGSGIVVEARIEPPSGNLTTDQLAIVQCDVGVHCLATPENNHADQMKHFGLLLHNVRIPYWVEGEQSCAHDFYNVDIRDGWETAFKFDRGGALHVFGCYLGGDLTGKLQTLLYVGRANESNGDFLIMGVQSDQSVKRLRLVDHGTYVFQVRLGGNLPFPANLDAQYVFAHDGPTPFADIKSDVRNAPWPMEAAK